MKEKFRLALKTVKRFVKEWVEETIVDVCDFHEKHPIISDFVLWCVIIAVILDLTVETFDAVTWKPWIRKLIEKAERK